MLVGGPFSQASSKVILNYFQLIVVAFSRSLRAHLILFWPVCSQKKLRFFGILQIGRPVSFFRGFWPRFRVHLLRHSCAVLWLLFRRFSVFFELDFTLIAFDKKGNAVLMQTGLRFSGRAKTVHQSLECVPLGWFGSGLVIQGHSD